MDTISATEFNATCLELFDQFAAGEIDELAVTKRGKVVAVIRTPVVSQTDVDGL